MILYHYNCCFRALLAYSRLDNMSSNAPGENRDIGNLAHRTVLFDKEHASHHDTKCSPRSEPHDTCSQVLDVQITWLARKISQAQVDSESNRHYANESLQCSSMPVGLVFEESVDAAIFFVCHVLHVFLIRGFVEYASCFECEHGARLLFGAPFLFLH